MAEEWLYAAGRILERAYREDNGLPPDVAPITGGEHNAAPELGAAGGTAIVMKPFVVAASHIHDPRLLAVYGLYEHDIGHDEKAREFLHAAVISGAVRPRANLVLAEILYSRALAAPAGTKRKLSSQQVAGVMGALDGALRPPPSSDAYATMAETWLHSDAMPDNRALHEIDEGVAYFPRNTGLVYVSALVCARAGYYDEASRLLEQGLPLATDEKARSLLAALHATLGTALASAAR
jgi:hypothetical protein